MQLHTNICFNGRLNWKINDALIQLDWSYSYYHSSSYTSSSTSTSTSSSTSSDTRNCNQRQPLSLQSPSKSTSLYVNCVHHSLCSFNRDSLPWKKKKSNSISTSSTSSLSLSLSLSLDSCDSVILQPNSWHLTLKNKSPISTTVNSPRNKDAIVHWPLTLCNLFIFGFWNWKGGGVSVCQDGYDPAN